MDKTRGGVVRILYKEIKLGDLRKIKAESNDAATGGGARDFRFGSFESLLPAIKKMFPETLNEKRRRAGKSSAEVYKGVFHWETSAGGVDFQDSYFESPTDARPSEGRIRRIHQYKCFDTANLPQGGPENRVLVLFIQLENDSVWPFFAEERTLRQQGLWDPVVANEILECLDAERPAVKAVVGYKDFSKGSRYCNGKLCI